MPKAQPRISWGGLSDEQRNEITDGRIAGKSVEFLHEEYGISGPVESLGRRIREWSYKRGTQRGKVTVGRGEFEKHWKLYCSLINRNPKRPIPKGGKKKIAKRRKVVVMCDTHGNPDRHLVAAAIEVRADIYVIGGDCFDLFAASKFVKTKTVPIADELANVRAMLEAIVSQTGARVLMISGNHDDRILRYFSRMVEPQFLPLVQWNMLELAAAGIEGVEVVNNTYDFRAANGRQIGHLNNGFIAHIGDDALITHAEISRKGEARTVDAVAEWVDRWRKPLGWPEPALIIQAHVHRASISWPHGGHQIRVEGGYSGEIEALQYSHDLGSAVYTPPVLGFTEFSQRESGGKWLTDLESVRFRLC